MKTALLAPANWDPQFHELDRTCDILRPAGIEAEPLVWSQCDDAALDRFDAIVPLVAWGYHLEPERWFNLLDRVEQRGMPIANPLEILRWNSDKSYLADLSAKGVDTVPSIVGTADEGDELLERARTQFGDGELIVKPVVSAAAAGTYRLAPGAPFPSGLNGRRMLAQPFMESILDQGEMSLIYFGGRFSHAAIKRAKAGDFRVQPEFGGMEEQIDPPISVSNLAEAALAAAPGATAYARVDIVMDGETPRIMELELIEPDLFLRFAPDDGKTFASSIAATLRA